MREQIACRVKFVFQSAEEYAPSGAMLMVRDGVMDDIDCMIALHCQSTMDVGFVGVMPGAQNATSDGFTLDFYGKSCHVATQNKGVDAIMMAVKAYTDIEFMIAKEFDAQTPPDVSIENYHAYVELFYEYCAKATHEEEKIIPCPVLQK